MDELLIALVVWLGKLIARAYRGVRSWWRRRGELPDSHRSPSAERAGSSEMPGALAGDQARRARETLAALGDEAVARAATLGRSPLGQPLARAVERGVVAPCGDLRRELDGLSAGSRLATELERIDSKSASLKQLLDTLVWMARQREDPSLGASWAAADRIAEACQEALGSILAGDRRAAVGQALCFLAPRQPVALQGFASAGLLPVPVRSPFPDHLSGWASVASGSGMAFLERVDGLKWELRSRFGLPDRYPVPFAPRGFLSRDDVLLPFGSWLETLFGDLVGSLLLGPTYAMALGRLLASPQTPGAVATVGVSRDGSLYSPEPPAQVRMAVSVAAMDDRGDDDLRQQLWSDWNEQHGWPAVMYLPTRMAGWIEAPMSAFTQMAEEVADLMLFEPMSSLGDRSLDGIPALAHSRMERDVGRARELALAGGDGSTTDPRLLLAGALAAAWAKPRREAELLRWMMTTLAPRDEPAARGRDAYAIGPGRGASTGGWDGRGGEPCRDDPVTVLRDAVVLDAILTRSRPGGGGWARR